MPYIVGIWVGVDATGRARAAAGADLGPVTLRNACLTYDPVSGEYRGGARVEALGQVWGQVVLTGEIDAWGSDFLCLLEWVTLNGGLEADAKAAAPITAGYNVDLVCRYGELWVEHGFDLETCLELAFDLDAFFNLDILGYRLIQERWNLAKTDWEGCWTMTYDFAPVLVGQEPTITFDSDLLRIFELVQWLFGEATDNRQIRDIGRDPARRRGVTNPCGDEDGGEDGGDTCTEVIENPVTSDTAHSLSSLIGRIDRTEWATELFSLPTGGSDSAGVLMESPFLTERHAPGSDSTGNAQKDIYGFRKLPQRGAFGGSGFSATQVYIKGHLLNARIGGPAEDRNLYPITQQANTDHHGDVETDVKKLVKQDHLLVYYKVDARDRADPVPIDVFGDGSCTYYFSDSRFDCTYATYKLCNDEILERNPETNRTVHSRFDLPGFIAGVRDKNCPQR